MRKNTKKLLISTGLVWVVSVISSCDEKPKSNTASPADPFSSAVSLPTERLTIGGEVFTVELAFQQHTRLRGLMFRESLPANAGMLFLFEREKPRSFYMKNCLIDLDILFIKADGEIARISTMKVPEPGKPLIYYSCETPVKYVLELPAGTAGRLGIKAGQKIVLTSRITNALPDPENS